MDCADETLQSRFKLFNVMDTVKGLLSHTSVSTRSYSALHRMRAHSDSSSGSPEAPGRRRTPDTTIDIESSDPIFAKRHNPGRLATPHVTVADVDDVKEEEVVARVRFAAPGPAPEVVERPIRISQSLHEASMPDIPRRSRRTKSVPDTGALPLRPGEQTLIKHFDVLEGAIEASSSRRGFFGRTRSPADRALTSHVDVTYYSPQDQLEVRHELHLSACTRRRLLWRLVDNGCLQQVFEDSLDNFKADRAALVELVLDRLFVVSPLARHRGCFPHPTPTD